MLSDQAPVSVIYRFTDLHAAAVEDRLLISAALMITVIAVAVAAMDMSRRRRLAETDRSGPLAPLRRLLLPSLAVSLVLLVIGVILAAGPGALALSRLAGYFDHAKPLSGYGVVKTFLPAGQETVFVGCTEAISCPPLLANEVDVRDGAASPLLTFSDPSHDRLTENDKPLAGAVSFTVPLSGSYIISTTGGRGWLLRLATGEGQEARALAAWAVVAALGLVLMVTELVAVVLYVRVRHLARRCVRATSIISGAVCCRCPVSIISIGAMVAMSLIRTPAGSCRWRCSGPPQQGPGRPTYTSVVVEGGRRA